MTDGFTSKIEEKEREISKLKTELTKLENQLKEEKISESDYNIQKLELQKTIRANVRYLHDLKQEQTGNKLPQLPTIGGKREKPSDADLQVRIIDPLDHLPKEMQLIDTLEVPGNEKKSIQLLFGDLTNIPQDHAVDILIVSSYLNDYYPVPGTLIHALYEKGVNIQELSADMKYDYRKELSCWLSQKITDKQDGINFDHVLIFEGFQSGLPSETVGDIFRAMFPFLIGETNKVATSLVSTGGAGMDREIMMEKLVEGAYYWMKNGLPLHELKIVIYNQSTLDLVTPLFHSLKQKFDGDEKQSMQSIPDSQEHLHNVFISYSHQNSAEAEQVFQALKELNENLSIFMDKLELQPGSSWQQEIFNSLEKSQLILTLLSPNYLESKVCIEEFDIAMMRNREADDQILFPLLISETKLPYYMRMIQYLDLQEFQPVKVKQTLQQIIKRIDNLTSSTGDDTSQSEYSTGQKVDETASQEMQIDEETLIKSILGLQKVYGKKLPLNRIAERNQLTFSQMLAVIEDLIISGKITAKIDSMGTSTSEDDFLILE